MKRIKKILLPLLASMLWGCIPQWRTLLESSKSEDEIALQSLSLLNVSPTSALMGLGSTKSFKITGGTPPYVVSLKNDATSGNLNTQYLEKSGDSFIYTAPSAATKPGGFSNGQIQVVDTGVNQQLLLMPIVVGTSNVNFDLSPTSTASNISVALKDSVSSCAKVIMLGGLKPFTIAYDLPSNSTNKIRIKANLADTNLKPLPYTTSNEYFYVCGSGSGTLTSAVNHGVLVNDSSSPVKSRPFYVTLSPPPTSDPLNVSPTSLALTETNLYTGAVTLSGGGGSGTYSCSFTACTSPNVPAGCAPAGLFDLTTSGSAGFSIKANPDTVNVPSPGETKSYNLACKKSSDSTSAAVSVSVTRKSVPTNMAGITQTGPSLSALKRGTSGITFTANNITGLTCSISTPTHFDLGFTNGTVSTMGASVSIADSAFSAGSLTGTITCSGNCAPNIGGCTSNVFTKTWPYTILDSIYATAPDQSAHNLTNKVGADAATAISKFPFGANGIILVAGSSFTVEAKGGTSLSGDFTITDPSSGTEPKVEITKVGSTNKFTIQISPFASSDTPSQTPLSKKLEVKKGAQVYDLYFSVSDPEALAETYSSSSVEGDRYCGSGSDSSYAGREPRFSVEHVSTTSFAGSSQFMPRGSANAPNNVFPIPDLLGFLRNSNNGLDTDSEINGPVISLFAACLSGVSTSPDGTLQCSGGYDLTMARIKIRIKDNFTSQKIPGEFQGTDTMSFSIPQKNDYFVTRERLGLGIDTSSSCSGNDSCRDFQVGMSTPGGYFTAKSSDAPASVGFNPTKLYTEILVGNPKNPICVLPMLIKIYRCAFSSGWCQQ